MVSEVENVACTVFTYLRIAVEQLIPERADVASRRKDGISDLDDTAIPVVVQLHRLKI